MRDFAAPVVTVVILSLLKLTSAQGKVAYCKSL
jgi:hypothetical protein